MANIKKRVNEFKQNWSREDWIILIAILLVILAFVIVSVFSIGSSTNDETNQENINDNNQENTNGRWNPLANGYGGVTFPEPI